MIDLGLPSGTKWACCNVGATTPEANGNYYAWGETQPKGNYSDRTYQYYQDKTWVNIGSDIAGTYYDAATASWGAPWRMPTEDQCEELKNECSIVWTTYNGVYGRMFIGPNDSTVFLPAVGGYRGALFKYEGKHGFYWSSTFSYNDEAKLLYFTSEGASFDALIVSAAREWGNSVRPVR